MARLLDLLALIASPFASAIDQEFGGGHGTTPEENEPCGNAPATPSDPTPMTSSASTAPNHHLPRPCEPNKCDAADGAAKCLTSSTPAAVVPSTSSAPGAETAIGVDPAAKLVGHVSYYPEMEEK